jgi:glycerophosphoryl diester phosphodiesterase
LKTLRARERLPELRRANTRWDRAFEIPTFEDVLELVAAADAQRAIDAGARGLPAPPRIGLYPETKHPSYFASLGLHFDERMLAALARHGYSKRNDPVFLQSFEVGNLEVLRGKTDLSLVQLVAPEGQPADFALSGDRRTYLDLMSVAGLKQIATYADAIGPHKGMVVTYGPAGAADTGLARRARAAGLGVHVWTLRAENEFLPDTLRSSGDVAAHGDMDSEIRALLDAGITGFFSDFPDLAVRSRDGWWATR